MAKNLVLTHWFRATRIYTFSWNIKEYDKFNTIIIKTRVLNLKRYSWHTKDAIVTNNAHQGHIQCGHMIYWSRRTVSRSSPLSSPLIRYEQWSIVSLYPNASPQIYILSIDPVFKMLWGSFFRPIANKNLYITQDMELSRHPRSLKINTLNNLDQNPRLNNYDIVIQKKVVADAGESHGSRDLWKVETLFGRVRVVESFVGGLWSCPCIPFTRAPCMPSYAMAVQHMIARYKFGLRLRHGVGVGWKFIDSYFDFDLSQTCRLPTPNPSPTQNPTHTPTLTLTQTQILTQTQTQTRLWLRLRRPDQNHEVFWTLLDFGSIGRIVYVSAR